MARKFRSLQDKFPEVAAQWHPTKNGDAVPDDFLPQSNKKVWWLGDCGHEWSAIIQGRTKKGYGCPYCAGTSALQGFNDLGTTHPHIASQWHPEKNGSLTSSDLLPGASQKVWWLGDCGHEWLSSPASRTSKRHSNGCPYCSNKLVLAGFNDLVTTKPEVAALWHPDMNSLSPQEVTEGSNQKVWWLGDCEHSWDAPVKQVSRGGRCPYCANKRVLVGFNDLASRRPHLALLWHPSRNAFSPEEVAPTSQKKAWFVCSIGHEWEAVISDAPEQCVFCSGRRVLTGFNDLATTHPNLAQQWHPTKNNKLTPHQVTKGSGKRVWWICDKRHEWQVAIPHRVNGTGCPYCAGQRSIVGKNDLVSQHPDIAKQWHPTKNGVLSPSGFMRGSNLKVWWQCELGHEWQAKITDRASDASRSTGCPSCFKRASKMETELADWLMSCLPTTEKIETSIRTVIHPYELDIYFPERNLAIEFNGLYWHSEKGGKDKNYHRNKWNRCNEKGIQLIQVWEDDWRDRRDIIQSMLLHKLNASSAEGRTYARQANTVSIEKKEAQEFLEKNHIQGAPLSGRYVGLRRKSDDKLIAVMALQAQGEDLLLSRYATSVVVPGGQSKLVKFVERTFEYKNLITFADLEVSNGNLYEATGFVEDKILEPDYKYLYGGERQHKFRFRIERFRKDEALLYEEGLTERELANLNNIARVWDSGKMRYIKPNPYYKTGTNKDKNAGMID